MRTVAPGVHVVSHLPWRAPGVVNSYLVDGDEGVTLIDTGLPWMGHGRVRAVLAGIGRSAGDVTATPRDGIISFSDHTATTPKDLFRASSQFWQGLMVVHSKGIDYRSVHRCPSSDLNTVSLTRRSLRLGETRVQEGSFREMI